MIWKIVRGLLIFLAIAIVVLAAWPWLTPLTEKFGSSKRLAYLSEHLKPLNLSAPGEGLALEEDDYAARYIILGEMHGFAVPQRLDLALVEHLQRRASPRWYLAEMTPAEALAVNEYLAGGDDAAVRAVFDGFADATLQWANHEFFDKLTAFRNLNAQLGDDAQIRFIGIDALRAGQQALPATPDAPATETADLANFASARAINLNLLDRARAAGAERRYEAMRHNLERLAAMPGFESARFMGLWGTFHASEVPINGSPTLAMWLQDSTMPYAGEVVTINFVCTSQCYNMMPKAGLPGPMHGPAESEYTIIPMHMDNPYIQRLRGVDDLVATMAEKETELALLQTDGENTPYAAGSNLLTGYSGFLPLINPWKAAGSASEMSDYFVISRASAPLTPWRGRAYDIEAGEMRKEVSE